MQAVIALAADQRVGAPQAEPAIAFDGGGKDRLADVGEIALEGARDLARRRGAEPAQGAVHGARHLEKLVSAPRECLAPRHQGGVGGVSARRRGVPDMARAGGDQLLGVGLEELDGVEPASAQRGGVFHHGRPRDAVEAVEVETDAAQVVGQADPGRRHLGNRGESHAGEVGQAEIRPRPGADHEERIARHDVGEADEIGIGVGVVGDHDSKRPTPHHVDLAGFERADGGRGFGRGL